jgi:hypothetical protein
MLHEDALSLVACSASCQHPTTCQSCPPLDPIRNGIHVLNDEQICLCPISLPDDPETVSTQVAMHCVWFWQLRGNPCPQASEPGPRHRLVQHCQFAVRPEHRRYPLPVTLTLRLPALPYTQLKRILGRSTLACVGARWRLRLKETSLDFSGSLAPPELISEMTGADE